MRISKTSFILIIEIFIYCFICSAAPLLAAPATRYVAKPRPAAGIGILTFHTKKTNSLESITLYEEPGLIRIADLNVATIPPFEHIFGNYSSTHHLIVTARKQQWLKVIYDDAGREAWLNSKNNGDFKLYPEWLRQEITRLLPGLQQKYYQLYGTETGNMLSTLSHKISFKILKVHNSWAQVLTGQNQLGWLRWKDYDGRILIRLAPTKEEQKK